MIPVTNGIKGWIGLRTDVVLVAKKRVPASGQPVTLITELFVGSKIMMQLLEFIRNANSSPFYSYNSDLSTLILWK
jgi:hypothetical protein